MQEEHKTKPNKPGPGANNHRKWEVLTFKKRVVNDFVIPNKNPQTAEQHRGRHFQIQFDLQSYNYFIKDLGVGYGVFVRQEEPIVSCECLSLLGAQG